MKGSYGSVYTYEPSTTPELLCGIQQQQRQRRRIYELRTQRASV